jgi:predicted dehydrogenase
MRTVRFGLIGCGYQGRYLSEALALAGWGEFAACADINAEALVTTAQRCGYRDTYSDYQRMLERDDIEAVIVATTHDQLQPAALAAAQAGKHVFVEKPMALNAAKGRELVAAARQAGVRVMIDYTMRFMPARLLMKQLLDAGAIGEVVHIAAGQLIGTMGGWLADPAHGGGPVLYIGAHVLDQVLWVAGRPAERVFAEVNRPKADGVEASALATIRFAGGAVGQVCCSSQLGGRYGWLDVFGTAGRMHAEWESHTLTIQSEAVDAYRDLTHIDVPVDAGLPPMDGFTKVSVVAHYYIRAWAGAMAEFVAAISEDRDPSVTGEDGVRVLEVTDAIFASGRSGQAVDL